MAPHSSTLAWKIPWTKEPGRLQSMDTIKNRNGMDLTEAEDIKKRWQIHRRTKQEDLNDSDNHNGVITHLEPDILEWEDKWA